MPMPRYLHCDQPLHVAFLGEACMLPEELTSETEEEPRGSDSQLKGSLSVSFIDYWMSVMVVGVQNTGTDKAESKASILAGRREQSCLKSISDKCCDGKHPTRICKPKTVKEVLGMGAPPFLFVILRRSLQGGRKNPRLACEEGNLGKEHIQYKGSQGKEECQCGWREDVKKHEKEKGSGQLRTRSHQA